MKYLYIMIYSLMILSVASTTLAQNDYVIMTDPGTGNRYFTFRSEKGTVFFDHDKHQVVMKTDSCVPCHKTKTPTSGHTMTRFDQRYAHAFCKGCHREKGQGPVECHECHKENKK